jgi:hypothetical protein
MEKKEFKIPWLSYVLLFPVIFLINFLANLKGVSFHIEAYSGFYDSPFMNFLRLPYVVTTFGRIMLRMRYFFWYVKRQAARLGRAVGIIKRKKEPEQI